MKYLIGFIICCWKKEHVAVDIDYDQPAFETYYNDNGDIYYEIHLCKRCGLVYWIKR